MPIIPPPASTSSFSTSDAALPTLSPSTTSASTAAGTGSTSSSTSTTPSTSSTSSSTPSSTSSSTSSLSSSSTSSVVVVTSTSSFSSSSSSSSSTPLPTSTTSSSSSSLIPTSTSKPVVTTPTAPQTSTVFVPAPSSTTVTPTAVSRVSTGFFSHKGEVAGVFTAVGIVVVVIIAVIATTCIRRRRAERFDKDVAEAAMEAAASSRVNAYDDDPYPGGGYGGGAASAYSGYGGANAENPLTAGYSSESHGTYGQPPMETYPMHNVGATHGGFEVGQVVDAAAFGAGAAGIGARSRSMNRGNQDGYEERTPYPAFAGPPAGVPGQQGAMPDPYNSGAGLRYRRASGQEPELLGAAGLGAAASMGPGPTMNRRQSERTTQTHTSNSKSQGSFGPVAEGMPAGYGQNTSSTGHSPPLNDESYASHYQPGYASQPPQDPFRRGAMQAQPAPALPNPYAEGSDGDEDAYAYEGYTDDHHAEPRGSVEDDSFYGVAPRVLKVANE